MNIEDYGYSIQARYLMPFEYKINQGPLQEPSEILNKIKSCVGVYYVVIAMKYHSIAKQEFVVKSGSPGLHILKRRQPTLFGSVDPLSQKVSTYTWNNLTIEKLCSKIEKIFRDFCEEKK